MRQIGSLPSAQPAAGNLGIRPTSLPRSQILRPNAVNLQERGTLIPEVKQMESDLVNDSEYNDLTGMITISGFKPEFIGKYSIVYQGKVNGETVAIKVIRAVGDHSTMRRKVKRERTVWAALDHPNILPFYGHADDEDFEPFGAFVSPWYSRGDAGRFLEQHGDSLHHTERLELWRGVLNGVAFLHGYNPVIVHGDLKPGNILIDDEGNPRICDFGLARIIREEGSSGAGMTTTTEHTGTERFLAPELVTYDWAIPTTASDVYAVGCLGLEFIYSERPYKHHGSNHHGNIVVDIREGVPPATRWMVTDSSDFMWDLIESCWHQSSTRRPSVAKLLLFLEGPAHISDNISDHGPVDYNLTQGTKPYSSRDAIDEVGFGNTELRAPRNTGLPSRSESALSVFEASPELDHIMTLELDEFSNDLTASRHRDTKDKEVGASVVPGYSELNWGKDGSEKTNIICKGCRATIDGVRYQCVTCPSTDGQGYSLCAECDERSYQLHDPMHCFFKIPRQLHREIQQDGPLLPPLYVLAAGEFLDRQFQGSGDEPQAYLQTIEHHTTICDRCFQAIKGEWFHCAYCAKNLCEMCEAIDDHDPGHLFVVFKSIVDESILQTLTTGRPLIPYPVYA